MKKEVINLRESKEGCIVGFGGRKERREIS